MQDKSDAQLLRDYVERRDEAAFREIVARHTDFVYSAALRQVESTDLAADIAQNVFVDLARKAKPVSARLTAESSLAGWLHRSTRYAALNHLRDTRRRLTNERQAMEQLLNNSESSVDWEQIRPALDEALDSLGDEDREALLLRYFKNQDFRAVGLALGMSDDAAQKRVSRAVERLREFFSKRKATIGASGLAAVIAANAVQAAPTGLAVTISTAALAGTAVSTSTVIAATKAIAMTTLQKTLVTATVAVLTGAGIYEAHQALQLRDQVQTLRQQQAPLAEQIRQLQRERDDATNRLANLQLENAQLKANRDSTELLKLRGEVSRFRQLSVAGAAVAGLSASGLRAMMSDPAMKEYMRQMTMKYTAGRYDDLINELKLTPEQREKFVEIMGDAGWKITEAFSVQDQAGFEQVRRDVKANTDSQLQSLLGETGFARFKEFDDEIPARSTIEMLNDELGSQPLTDAQRASLLQIIKAEPWEMTHGIAGEVDKAFLGSPADVSDYLQRVAESNQRILQQAGGFLNPDQLAALNTVLTNGINTRKVYGGALIRKP